MLLLILFTIGGFLIQLPSVHAQSNLVLFWGDGCPHCEIVKGEIKKRGYDQKITIEYKEIYKDKDNAKLFDEKIKECGISPYNAGVPMLYVEGSCWMGEDEAIYAIEKEIEKSSNSVTSKNDNNNPSEMIGSEISEKKDSIEDNNQEENITLNKGKRNTETMLISIFIALVILVGIGYAIQNKKSKVLCFLLLLSSFFTFSLILASPVHAVCPVCTVAVGAGLGLSRYLGIDDVITSLWIGGIIVSTVYWIIDWLGKRNKKGLMIDILSTVITFVLVLIPLYWSGVIGHPFNTFWGVDKIILGTAIGSMAFFLGAQLHFYLIKQNKNKVGIPFQKVVFPVGALWLMSLILYFIIY